MKKTLTFFLIISSILLSCSQEETITVDEVTAVINRFDTAWQFKKAAVVDSVLADQYIYFTQSGGTFSRDNIVTTAASSEYKLEKAERKRIAIKIDGNTAVVNTTWHGKGSYYNKPFDDLQRCSITLIKRHGKVEILSEHCTPIN